MYTSHFLHDITTYFQNELKGLFFPIAFGLFAIFIILNFFSFLNKRFYAVLLLFSLLVLIAVRGYSIFYPFALDSDEGIWLSLVSRSEICSIPFKCFNASTSGFLNIFLLRVISFLGCDYNYVSLRAFGLFVCIIPTIVIFYFSVKRLFQVQVALISTCLLINYYTFGCFRANVYDSVEHLAYNTEHVVMLFTSALFYLYVRYRENHSMIVIVLSALLIGTIPFIKLQSVPIVLVFFLAFTFPIYRHFKFKGVFSFILCCTVPLIIIGLFLLQWNVFDDFWSMYIATNFNYTQSGGLNFRDKFYLFRELEKFFLPYVSLMLFLLVVNVFNRKNALSSKISFDPVIIFWFLASEIAIWAVGLFFGHYNVLVVVPFFLFIANLFASLKVEEVFNQMKWTFAYLLLIVCMNVYFFVNQPFRHFSYSFHKGKLASYIDRNSSSNETIAILTGFNSNTLFMESERVPATRTTDHYLLFLTDDKLRKRFQRNYIEDLAYSKPSVIIAKSSLLNTSTLKSIKYFISKYYKIDTTLITIPTVDPNLSYIINRKMPIQDTIDCYKMINIK